MNLSGIMFVPTLFILMNALAGQSFRMRLKRKPASEPSLLSFSSPTDKDPNELFSPQLKKYKKTSGLRRVSGKETKNFKNQKMNWLVRPPTGKTDNFLKYADEDFAGFWPSQNSNEQRILRDSRNENPAAYVDNYRKYEDSNFKLKNGFERAGEIYEGVANKEKSHEKIPFAAKKEFKNRPDSILIRLKDDKNKKLQEKPLLKQNRAFTKEEMKRLMKKIGRAFLLAFIAFSITSFVFLIATILGYVCTKLLRGRIFNLGGQEGPQRPKSIFYINSSEQPSKTTFYVDSEEQKDKKTVLPSKETTNDKGVEKNSPASVSKQTKNTVQGKSDSISPTGAKNANAVSGKQNTESSTTGRREKEKEHELNQNNDLTKPHDNEDEESKSSDKKAACETAVRVDENNDSSAEDKPNTPLISTFSVTNQVHDLYTVPEIEHVNLKSNRLIEEEKINDTELVTHLGDTNEYEISFVDHDLTVTLSSESNWKI